MPVFFLIIQYFGTSQFSIIMWSIVFIYIDEAIMNMLHTCAICVLNLIFAIIWRREKQILIGKTNVKQTFLHCYEIIYFSQIFWKFSLENFIFFLFVYTIFFGTNPILWTKSGLFSKLELGQDIVVYRRKYLLQILRRKKTSLSRDSVFDRFDCYLLTLK